MSNRLDGYLQTVSYFFSNTVHDRRPGAQFVAQAVRTFSRSKWLTFMPVVWMLSSCSITSDVLRITDVKPWERGALARDDMQPVSDIMDNSVDEHIYFSKEASTGGASISGGGCGCN